MNDDERMYRVFLSMPFRDRSEAVVRAMKAYMKEYIKDLYKNFNLEFIWNYEYKGIDKLDNITEALKKISVCDFVAFSPNYKEAHGCLTEEWFCKEYEIKTIYVK